MPSTVSIFSQFSVRQVSLIDSLKTNFYASLAYKKREARRAKGRETDRERQGGRERGKAANTCCAQVAAGRVRADIM